MKTVVVVGVGIKALSEVTRKALENALHAQEIEFKAANPQKASYAISLILRSGNFGLIDRNSPEPVAHEKVRYLMISPTGQVLEFDANTKTTQPFIL